MNPHLTKLPAYDFKCPKCKALKTCPGFCLECLAASKTSTLPAVGVGHSTGMSAQQILILAQLIHWNPSAWANLLRELPANSTFQEVQELTGERLLVTTISGPAVARRWLISLDTCQVIDQA